MDARIIQSAPSISTTPNTFSVLQGGTGENKSASLKRHCEVKFFVQMCCTRAATAIASQVFCFNRCQGEAT